MNAKTEFLNHTNMVEKVKCAILSYEDYWSLKPNAVELPVDFTEEELKEFLNKLNFEYDSGYGSQELFGTIWYTDGTWSERRENDGYEYWVYKEVPTILETLKTKQ